MVLSIHASLETEKNELESQGILTLFQVQVQASPVTYAYWSGYNASTDYFQPGTATPQTYTPFPIARGEVESDDGTKTPSMTIHVGAVDQQITAYLENQDGLRRNRVKAITVPYRALGNASACIVDTFYIDGGVIDHDKEEAVFELTSKGQVEDITVPMRVTRRDQCQWKYNASYCLASFTADVWKSQIADIKCKLTKTDCASKDNVINFGAFPGISTGNVYF